LLLSPSILVLLQQVFFLLQHGRHCCRCLLCYNKPSFPFFCCNTKGIVTVAFWFGCYSKEGDNRATSPSLLLQTFFFFVGAWKAMVILSSPTILVLVLLYCNLLCYRKFFFFFLL
jgi:hypothetical protein